MLEIRFLIRMASPSIVARQNLPDLYGTGKIIWMRWLVFACLFFELLFWLFHPASTPKPSFEQLPKEKDLPVPISKPLLEDMKATSRTEKSSVPHFEDPHASPPGEGLNESERLRVARLQFMRDTSRPSLGIAFRDRRGLLWGEIPRIEGSTEFNDSTSKRVTWAEANQVCRDGGNRLPTLADLEKLVVDFGADKEKGHKMHVSPEEFSALVSRSQGGEPAVNGGYDAYFDGESQLVFPTFTFQRYWTATAVPANPALVYIFNAHYGLVQEWNRDAREPYLCVFDPRERKLPSH